MEKDLRKKIIDKIVYELNNCSDEKFAGYITLFMFNKENDQVIHTKNIPPIPKLEQPRTFKGI